ncbi:UNVERIFIED_CONTAM: hypothetical protein PYX00_004573 [Menopon gallinae]|uniref:Uncharacterized protein n=1 Tax=Menopon gallinae TaxID=328185 RepID=A0AAW2I582_9NEOP
MIALCVVALLFGVVSCDLTIAKTKECGQITCDYLYYCSNIENACRPCRKICDVGGNQDMRLCNRHCQDYIHDMRYLKRDEVVDNAKEQIDKLQVLTTISLIFSLIAFVFFVLGAVMLWFSNKAKLNILNINAQMKSKKEKPDIMRNDDRMQINSSEISTIRIQNDAVVNMQDITDIISNKSIPPQSDYYNMTTFKNPHAKYEPDSASSVHKKQIE